METTLLLKEFAKMVNEREMWDQFIEVKPLSADVNDA